jgi:hypothetical protein
LRETTTDIVLQVSGQSDADEAPAAVRDRLHIAVKPHHRRHADDSIDQSSTACTSVVRDARA